MGMWGWWRGHVSVAMGTLSAGGAGVGEQTARCGERLPQPHEPRRGRNSAVSDAVDLVRHATSAGPTACHRLRAVTSLPAASGDNPSPPHTSSSTSAARQPCELLFLDRRCPRQ